MTTEPLASGNLHQAQPWEGRVWMNPPFSTPDPWVRRFIGHRNGVCLVPVSNGRWFHALWQAADGMVLPTDNALKFAKRDGKGLLSGIPLRCVLAAFGESNVAALSAFGMVRHAA